MNGSEVHALFNQLYHTRNMGHLRSIDIQSWPFQQLSEVLDTEDYHTVAAVGRAWAFIKKQHKSPLLENALAEQAATAKIANIRFKYFLRCVDVEELLLPLERVIKTAPRCNPFSVAYTVKNWGETLRRKMAERFYRRLWEIYGKDLDRLLKV